MSTLTKDERYEIYRLIKRARGLFKAEKQALVFIGDAQTMQDGVCRKALKSAEDFGFSIRQIRFGLHGRRRNGKIEFPGLIARGIVSAVRNEKGGRAPGGHGLPTAYAINRDVLLTFIPEIDDPFEKAEPKGEPSSEKAEPLGEPKEELMPTSSCSSLSSSPAGRPAAPLSGERPQGVESVRGASGNSGKLVDDDGETNSQPPAAAGGHKGSGQGKTSGSFSQRRESQVEPLGRENQSEQTENQDREDRMEQIISVACQRQLERSTPDVEIFREYKAVFDRLRREHDANINVTPAERHAQNLPCGKEFENDLRTNADHRRAAAELYRAIGREAALAKWEDFLVNEEHETTQRVEYDEGKFTNETVERSWLLHDFVIEHGVSTTPIEVR